MNLAHWVRRPHLIAARLRYWWYTRRRHDEPWLCPGTNRFLEGLLGPDSLMVEFGSGRSTRWFAKRVRRIISVEHNADWSEQVRQQLQSDNATNVDYRVVPLDHPPDAPEPLDFDPMPSYVRVVAELDDDSLDLVLVDGHYRTHCVKAAAAKLRPGGVLLVDDIGLWPPGAGPWQILSDWPIADDSTNGVKRAVAWRKPAP